MELHFIRMISRRCKPPAIRIIHPLLMQQSYPEVYVPIQAVQRSNRLPHQRQQVLPTQLNKAYLPPINSDILLCI